MRVLVTGAAGYFGRCLVPVLLADPRITAVLATDRVPLPLEHPRLRFVARDMLTEGAADLVSDVDAVVHLAFAVERRPGQDTDALNIAANQRFLSAAATAEALVFVSSVMAYGLRRTPFDRLSEDDAPESGGGFYYSEQKIATEAWLAALAPTARARIVIARPCVVGGPTIPPGRAALYRGRVMVLPHVDHPLRYQMLHEADLGPALATLLTAPAGTYNLAPDDEITLADAATLLGMTRLTLPMGLCALALDAAWRLGASPLDGDWVRSLGYPSHVVTNDKLKALGWAPRYTTREALLAVRG